MLQVDLPVGEPRQELLQGDAPFQPRQCRSEAKVDAVAEGEVTAVVATDVEAIPVRKAAVVPVGGADQEEDGVPGGTFSP